MLPLMLGSACLPIICLKRKKYEKIFTITHFIPVGWLYVHANGMCARGLALSGSFSSHFPIGGSIQAVWRCGCKSRYGSARHIYSFV